MTLTKLSYIYILPGQVEISRPSFDEEELLSDAVQRVWWYLHLFETNPEVIQSFRFNPQRKLMDPAECLETLIRFATLIIIIIIIIIIIMLFIQGAHITKGVIQ